ncbi:MAG: hypothetical protein NC206_04000 [Bacteroides sp.]|nr:hypothetical protein [Roseburia sp.]MCM1346230.1 hypothetical protein [Bacteroides sp.]MCM1420707.1 hypothetical protein [Bacteroides sp.]
MKKVFVFCIGGTGLRVMKSITMLLAAGMDAKGFAIVPVLIDPHMDLEEKRNLQSLINEYETIYNSIIMGDGKRLQAIEGFFGTDIADLAKLNGQQNDISEPIAEKRSFGQYINRGNLNSGDVNNYLVQTMFSQANLDNDLSVGFKGSPNVGTVVLGEMIKGADWFQAFCNTCQKDDRIFIVSSIFGGTGASGYPLLEKKVRNSTDHPNVKDAMMGAVSVLPYFALEDPSTTDSDIDSANFLTKTKSALAYYENSVLSDYLYYIGEQSMKKTYANDEKQQDDPAHFIELVAATALFDFLAKTDKPEKPQVLSRSIKEDVESLSISSLGDPYNDIVKAVADMMLLSRLVHLLPKEKHFPLSINRGFNKDFYEDKSFVNLQNFLSRFAAWYHELETNNRGFAPLTIAPLEKRNDDLSNWIQDFSLDAKDESYYLLEMIRASNRDKDGARTVKFRRFLDYAYKAINKYTSKIIM